MSPEEQELNKFFEMFKRIANQKKYESPNFTSEADMTDSNQVAKEIQERLYKGETFHFSFDLVADVDGGAKMDTRVQFPNQKMMMGVWIMFLVDNPQYIPFMYHMLASLEASAYINKDIVPTMAALHAIIQEVKGITNKVTGDITGEHIVAFKNYEN